MTREPPVYDPVEYHRRVLDIARNVVREEAGIPTVASHAGAEVSPPAEVDAERAPAPSGRVA